MLVGNGWVQWLTCVGGHATDSCFELKLLATCRGSIAGSNGCRRKSMVVQWLKVDGGNLYGRHHVAAWAAQRASYAGASSTIASCGSEGMVWPPTDSRRTLADRHGSFAVRACLGCSGVKHAVAWCLPHSAAPRCETFAGAGGM
ncbi:uncharacterized protein LOC120431904 [Culex pipiens pallens]|uniref:uncharacterized protein LOC120431904 n=1 Tax=Culex pipiens pallens TaxID=42434 RepID=UPI0019548CFD|nr:uncharacterized protein LOC120431904 [Culex pipiens pallens]